MVFERKMYQRLLQWKREADGRTAALIEGARRIGKSTVARMFAENEYKSYILIDFSIVDKAVTDAFEHSLSDLDEFFFILAAVYGKTLYPRESLIIFDEVQFYPKARQAVKWLVQDGRYDYLETGSLISIRENVKDILIPSEEEHFKMYPMDFEEFAAALGEAQLTGYIRTCFMQKKPLPDALHRKAMLLFKQYMLIGGMPRSVVAFLESGRMFLPADREKRMILSLYRADIRKIESKYQAKVQDIYDRIPSFLSNHEKRVRLSEVGGTSDFDRFEASFFWLADSMIVNECFNCRDPNVGLSLNEDRTFVKCYMGDTGLLLSHTFNERELSDGELYRQIVCDNLAVNKGMFYENAIAQMLTANGYELFFYTHYSAEKHRNDMELDFLISNGSKIKPKIFPIEVKSTKKYTTVSLEGFMETFSGRIGCGYVIHPKNLSVKDNIYYIPAYMTFCL